MSKDISESMNTPAMKQYAEVKKKYPDAIVFFRMGDFYEMFQDDAVIASSILDIALTKRQNQIPMAGIPYHATESYISRLLGAGKKVVICEQIKNENENVKLLQREVVRVISPGTVIEENLLSGFENNYFAAVTFLLSEILVAFGDVSTSDLYYFYFPKEDRDGFFTIMKKFLPREIILLAEEKHYWESYDFSELATITVMDNSLLDFSKNDPKDKFSRLKTIIDTLLGQNFKDSSFQFKTPVLMNDIEYMELGEETVRHLDLIENQNESNRHHSLFSVLNKCLTGIGKRVLKNRILFPSKNKSKILSTWDRIAKLDQNRKIKLEVIGLLSGAADLERIISRFRGGKGLPRDFKTIIKNIEIAENLKSLLKQVEYDFNYPDLALERVYQFINTRLSEKELPAVLGGDGEFIREGYSDKLDRAREAKTKGKDWIIELEEKERKASGLNTLKIRYNKVVGFYVELSRKDSDQAPKKYLKKQTLVTSERFTFSELEDIERTILEADEIIQGIEKEEFECMMKSVISEYHAFLELSAQIGELDYILSLCLCKDEYKWTLPEINMKGELSLVEARHPVIEKFLPLGDRFVANDVFLNTTNSAIAILTGPNMAGKSTYMRQIALSQILFQMGSYVPAKKASLSLVDKLFTRIGSGDDITTGQSTFFVEMRETAHILKNRTSESLILFDEIGRGTSTYDGMSLAWAILEHLARIDSGSRTKTIFATHYHELTSLDKEKGVFNLYMDTVEENEDVIFLKKVRTGKAKKSFGIYVAKLAGVPASVVERAKILLLGLESKRKEIKIQQEEPSLFPKENEAENLVNILIKRLEKIEIENITPLESMKILNELKKISSGLK